MAARMPTSIAKKRCNLPAICERNQDPRQISSIKKADLNCERFSEGEPNSIQQDWLKPITSERGLQRCRDGVIYYCHESTRRYQRDAPHRAQGQRYRQG